MATGKKTKPKGTAGRETSPATSLAPKSTKPRRKASSGSITSEPRTSGKDSDLGEPGEDRIAEFLKLSAREMAAHLFQHPEAWLDSPHPRFGGRTPNELIANGEEATVRNTLAAASLGLF